jgi:hypothetical protein
MYRKGLDGAAACVAAVPASCGDGLQQQAEPTPSTPTNHVQRLAVALRSSNARERATALAALASLLPLPTANALPSGMLEFETRCENNGAVRHGAAQQASGTHKNFLAAPTQSQDSMLQAVLVSGLPEALAARLKIGAAAVDSCATMMEQQAAGSELQLALHVVNGVATAFAVAGTHALCVGTGAILDAGLAGLLVTLASTVQCGDTAYAACAALGSLLWPWIVLASTADEHVAQMEEDADQVHVDSGQVSSACATSWQHSALQACQGSVRAALLMQLRAAGMPGAVASPRLLLRFPAASLALLGQWSGMFLYVDSEQQSVRQDWAHIEPAHLALRVRAALVTALRDPESAGACAARHLLEDWLCCPVMGVLVRRKLALGMTRLRARMPAPSPGHSYAPLPASPPPALASEMGPLSLDSIENEWAYSMLLRSTSGCGAPTCCGARACGACGLAMLCPCAASCAARLEHAPLCDLLMGRLPTEGAPH